MEILLTMKKIFSAMLMFICLLVAAVALLPQKLQPVSVSETAYVAPDAPAAEITTSAKSAYLVDAATGSVIYASGETNKQPIASMTKIMTLLLTLEEVDSGNMTLEDGVVVSHTASSMGGSQVFLEENATYTLGDLIKTVVVASANDSSVALAEHIAGSVESFVARMNERAKQLKMTDTSFVNCTGLPAPSHYSSAKDVSVMLRQLMRHKDYFKFTKIWTEDFMHPSGRKTNITNTNKLSRFYEGCDAGKTGYTSEAGHCLAASAKRGETRLVSVVVGEPDSKTRFADTMKMLNYGFANYESREVLKCEPLDVGVKVVRGKADNVQVCPVESYFEFCRKNSKQSEITFEYRPIEKLKAPVRQGDDAGTIIVFKNGVAECEIKLVAACDVEKANFIDMLKKIINKWSFIH